LIVKVRDSKREGVVSTIGAYRADGQFKIEREAWKRKIGKELTDGESDISLAP
jgi:hypothetical protein